MTTACSINSCNTPAITRGWCKKHYTRWRRHGDPTHRIYKESLWDRLWEKVDASGDCWEWTGAVNSAGYGQIWQDGKLAYAHRVVWELLVGPIPDALEIDHLCRNPPCVKPDHLEPVTGQINAVERGYGPAARNKRKTHCPKGHPYVDGNIYWTKEGARACRQCRLDHNRRAQTT